MYGFITGITDNNDIYYCPKCGNVHLTLLSDGTAACDDCEYVFGVVEKEPVLKEELGYVIEYRGDHAVRVYEDGSFEIIEEHTKLEKTERRQMRLVDFCKKALKNGDHISLEIETRYSLGRMLDVRFQMNNYVKRNLIPIEEIDYTDIIVKRMVDDVTKENKASNNIKKANMDGFL